MKMAGNGAAYPVMSAAIGVLGKRMRFSVLTVFIAALTLSACATPPNAEQIKRAKAWHSVSQTTDVTEVSSQRLRLRSKTPFAAGGDELEKATLLRAAGEVRSRGYERFAIVYVDYNERGLGSLMGPNLGESTKRWIGTYEDLLDARDRADLDGSLDGPFGFKSMDVVIVMLNDDEETRRDAFVAGELYGSLIEDRIERHKFKAYPRLAIPTPSIPFRN